MIMKVQFVKPVWLFVSGDTAIVPDRVGRWLTGNGYAYVSKLPEPVQEPVIEEVKQSVTFAPKLSTRGKKK